MIRTGEVSAQQLRATCESEAGLTLGLSITGNADAEFRIGHMGHLNPPMLLGTLGTIEAALTAVDAPMGGSGVAAAAAVIAQPPHRHPSQPPAPKTPGPNVSAAAWGVHQFSAIAPPNACGISASAIDA